MPWDWRLPSAELAKAGRTGSPKAGSGLHFVSFHFTHKLTRPQILAAWSGKQPGDATLWRWLERAGDQGLVLREGSGRRGDAFRYWLPGRDVPWEPDFLESLGLRP